MCDPTWSQRHSHGPICCIRSSTAGRPSEKHGGKPFHLAKRRWHEWIDYHVDHTLQLSDDDPLLDYFRKNEPERLARIMTFPGDPTTELLVCCFMVKAIEFFSCLMAADYFVARYALRKRRRIRWSFQAIPLLPHPRSPRRRAGGCVRIFQSTICLVTIQMLTGRPSQALLRASSQLLSEPRRDC